MAVFTKLEKKEIKDFLKNFPLAILFLLKELLKVQKIQILKLLLLKINTS